MTDAVFPHCMWGCIVPKSQNISFSGVPSLLCEGVSANIVVKTIRIEFPHCMWGCIAVTRCISKFGFVPSLYVRVYQSSVGICTCFCCSLTVCEGVSASKAEERAKAAFPHCMWGCIDWPYKHLFRNSVPSLYVRVYRYLFRDWVKRVSFLIICEGVSAASDAMDEAAAFPRCMWECITL